MDGPSGNLEGAMIDGAGEGAEGEGGVGGGGSARDESEQQLPPTTLLAAALMRNSISIEEGFAAVDVDQDGVLSLGDLMQVDPAVHNRRSFSLILPPLTSLTHPAHSFYGSKTNTQLARLHHSFPWTTDRPNTPTPKSHTVYRHLGVREAWH
jgi:hypothetical protein